MIENNTKTDKSLPIKEFKPVKKLSPFVCDPHNTRGEKSGKKTRFSASGSKGGKTLNISKFKGSSGGDR